MPRSINPHIDALFVEGPDDGVVVNALARRFASVELARRPYLVRTRDEGGGDAWAIEEFEQYVAEERPGARVGVIIDRDDATNDKWPRISAVMQRLGGDPRGGPDARGAILGGRYGIWMWPDNVSHGDLESFVSGIIPQAPILAYAEDACRIAKRDHAAEYEDRHARKAALKVRSIWRDASAAGGYGHLINQLVVARTPACDAFMAWFTALFLTE